MICQILTVFGFFLFWGVDGFSTPPKNKEPIRIKADEISFESNTHKAIALGNVVITQGNSILKAARVEAYFSTTGKNSKLRMIKAFHNVHLQNPDQVATGDKGSYDLEAEEIILEGNVTVNDHRNQIKGAYGIMNKKTGITRVLNQAPQAAVIESKAHEGPPPQVSALLVSSE